MFITIIMLQISINAARQTFSTIEDLMIPIIVGNLPYYVVRAGAHPVFYEYHYVLSFDIFGLV